MRPCLIHDANTWTVNQGTDFETVAGVTDSRNDKTWNADFQRFGNLVYRQEFVRQLRYRQSDRGVIGRCFRATSHTFQPGYFSLSPCPSMVFSDRFQFCENLLDNVSANLHFHRFPTNIDLFIDSDFQKPNVKPGCPSVAYPGAKPAGSPERSSRFETFAST